jgi:moderate conductance mechanosensitive channel
VVGLAIGFGSQQLVQDVITGLFIIIEDTHVGRRLGGGGRRPRGHRRGPDHPHPAPARRSSGFVHSVPFGQIKAVVNHSRQFAYAFFLGAVHLCHGCGQGHWS